MAVAAATADLDPLHAIGAVAQIRDVVDVERLVERRPAGARLELRRGAKERKPAEPAGIHAGFLVVQQAAAEWGLGPMIEEDPPLLGGQAPGESLAFGRGQRLDVVSGLRTRPHRRHYMISPRRCGSYGLSHAWTDGAPHRRPRFRLWQRGRAAHPWHARRARARGRARTRARHQLFRYRAALRRRPI